MDDTLNTLQTGVLPRARAVDDRRGHLQRRSSSWSGGRTLASLVSLRGFCIAALDKGLISGAGFDVVTQEPPPPDHPLMQLAARPNVILTPHVAWASQEAVQSLADQLVENIQAFWSGHPRNIVAP